MKLTKSRIKQLIIEEYKNLLENSDSGEYMPKTSEKSDSMEVSANTDITINHDPVEGAGFAIIVKIEAPYAKGEFTIDPANVADFVRRIQAAAAGK